MAEEPPPNVVPEADGAVAKPNEPLPKPPLSGLGEPKPPLPKVLPKPEPPNPPKPDAALTAKGEAPPKPPDDPNPPVPLELAPSDPKPPEVLAVVLPMAAKGDFSFLEKADSPEDANAEVEVVVCSLRSSAVWPMEAEPAIVEPDSDLDDANAAKGEALAVFAKPDVGLT